MEGSESSAKDDGGGLKGKSCKGCLYYSSIRKSKSRNPLCLGITGALQQVPESTVGGSDTDASKDARNLTEFKYACVGYSVHSHSKDHSADSKDKRAELPFCVGVELLLDKKPAAAEQVSGHVHNKEDDHGLPQPRPYKPEKPPHSTAEELLGRFARNAGLVASGVAKNLHEATDYVKDSFDDMLYPYRRPPK
ncbi:uncharacterized protein LOC113357687 isoform X1 [Papaver somniferum]|uniref:uncharacterized protein LOC113357687 isoform X1 n=1 Tax=Papaver somniferum TaxID=3469 RepID=UPI000E705A2B|nr:uncharacterized protein LOC113357687 isoform X1 [Papaver somniferum]